MKNKLLLLLGVVLMLGGPLFGLYIGMYRMIILSVINLGRAFDAGTLTGVLIATSGLKIWLGGCVSYAICYIAIYLGLKCME